MSGTDSGMDILAPAGGSAATSRADALRGPRLRWIRPVALFVLLSGCVVALTVVYMYQREMDNGRQLTTVMARLIEEQTSRSLQALDRDLQMVVRELQLQENADAVDPEARRDVLQRHFERRPLVRNVWITDAQGRILFGSQEKSSQRDASDRDYFRIHQQQPGTGFYVGVPVRSRLTQQWLISASRPILSPTGVFRGVIVAAIEPKYFDRLWDTTHQLLGGAVGLWRDDGTLMMRSPFTDSAIGKSYPALPLFRQLESTSGTGVFQVRSHFDGEHRIHAYRRLSAYPELLVVVGQSEALLTASWRRFTAITVVVWLVSCLAIGLQGAFLNRVWQQSQHRKNMLRVASERLELATEAGIVGVFDWDLPSGITYANAAYFSQVGQPARARVMSRDEWLAQVHPQDRTELDADIGRAVGVGNPSYTHEVRMLHTDGSYRWMRVTGRVMASDADGRATRLLGTRIDITERKQREQKLVVAEQSLRRLLCEQESLLREVHHRVKNNLQVIHSMLRLEASRRGSDARAVLLDMQSRVQSIALLHGMLYRVGEMASVDLGDYLRQLCHQAMHALDDPERRTRLQLDLASASVDMDKAMCCGLIVNELLSNCLKHGYPDGRDGEIRVVLQTVDGGARLRLRVNDDGVGLASATMPVGPTTMGLQLVVDLVAQLEGQLEVEDGPGAAFCIIFAAVRPYQPLPAGGPLGEPEPALPEHAMQAESP